MARILFVNQFYVPDVASTAQHLADLTEHLARLGHDVRVVCSRGLYSESAQAVPRREVRNGVTVLRVGPQLGRPRHLVAKVWISLLWHLAVARHVVCARRIDLVVSLTSPPMISFWGDLVARLRGRRHILWLMDLYPEVACAAGVLKPKSLIARWMQRIAGGSRARADASVVLGAAMAEIVERSGGRPERMVEIPIWSDGRHLAPMPRKAHPLRERFGWEDRFVVLYAGNAGRAHRFEEVLEAAEILERQRPEVLFVFSGGGAKRASIEATVAAKRLRNVQFLPYVDREEIGALTSAGDVGLVTLEPEMQGLAVPSKVQACLAVGRPIAYVGPPGSEAGRLLSEHPVGFAVEPRDGTGLAEGIEALLDDAAGREALNLRARQLFLEQYDLPHGLRAWEQVVECVLEGRSLADLQTAARLSTNEQPVPLTVGAP